MKTIRKNNAKSERSGFFKSYFKISPFIIIIFIMIFFSFLTSGYVFSQGVGISEASITPDASAILELRSTLRGLLAPRMTNAERDLISSPAQGLLIYNTDTDAFNYYDGTKWVPILNDGTGVTAVNGTLNRISVGGTPTVPVIDIDGSYIGQTSITTLGTIGTGTWQGDVIMGEYGGTGIANTGMTITLGGNIATEGSFNTSGANALTLTTTGATNVTLPTSGTLVNSGVTTLSSLSSIGTITTGTWNGTTIGIGYGGTGQTTATGAFDALSPMTTLGDIIYGGASGTGSRLTGNTTLTPMFLRQTGDGANSAAPVWVALSNTDVGLGNVENTALSTWAGSTNLTTLGTIGTGTWQGDVIMGEYGGTGIANTGMTITLGGNIATEGSFNTSGANALTLTTTGATNVTLPTSGTLVNSGVTTLSSLSSIGTITTGTWNGTTIGIGYGGTGQTTATGAFDALSPMTTLGDIIYGGASGTGSRLTGNTTLTPMFLRQTGDGANSAAPVWVALSNTDVGLGNVENTALSTWAGSTNLTTLGTIGTGTWQGDVIMGEYGGTGIANTGKTITLGGNFTTSGAHTTTLTTTDNTTVTLPVTGTLATLEGNEALTNKTINGNTITTGTGTLTIAAGKTLNASDDATISGINTGDQTITLTDDVTGSGTGSFATTIASNAVTYGKMQAVSTTSKLLGSSDASTAIQEITLGAGLNMIGSTINAAASTFDNPSALIGLTAINGSAVTAMRSDAAPALSQAIIPTWTGAHTWSALGTFNLGLNASGAEVNINANSNFATNINTGTSTGAVNIANGSTGGNAISIGNTNSTTSIDIRVGTGNFSLDGAPGSNYTIGSSAITGTISIGGTAQTGTIDIGTGTGEQTINLGTGGTGEKTINIGTGAIDNNITIGTITGTSSLTLNAGSGKIIVPDTVMLDISQVDNSTNTEGLKLPQSDNNVAATAEGQIAWDADDDVLSVGTGIVARNIGIPNGMAVFTASDPAWAHPEGVKYIWVKVWGGGGGGGNASFGVGDGGGGGGAYSEGLVDVSDAATHAIVVGAGGAANGGDGGPSSFTATSMTVSANGGNGTTNQVGGVGGTTSGTGTIQISGGNGGNGDNSDGAGGGTGGGSPFGGAGGSGGVGGNSGNPSVNGTSGTFPGGGGGGGSDSGGLGAAGAAGLVIVYW